MKNNMYDKHDVIRVMTKAKEGQGQNPLLRKGFTRFSSIL